MSTPSYPDWLLELIAHEGESKPIDAHERDRLIAALAAVQLPQAIDARRHRQILERALGGLPEQGSAAYDDPFAPPSAEELSAAESLREHFDSDPLVQSLRSAQRPFTPSSELEFAARETVLARLRKSPTRRARRLAPSAWGMFAAAAAAALWLVVKSNGVVDGSLSAQSHSKSLAVSRSTDSLFAKPFASSSNSERIDRIAQARSRELRDNRYTIWGLP